jgi:DNA polymerase-3 subunit gamma/tau
VQFLPVEASHKVFIIDEVHMLSTGAFNALLKTLEEPPKNIVFILATTELHKIPATIQSRSQTLHFRLLDTVQLTNHLSMVSQKEGVKIDPPALQKVVAVAKGGMRDALSLLDQLMNMATNQHITLSTVASALGTVNDDDLRVFLDHCFLAQSQAHTTLVQWLDQGIDPIQLYDDIVHYMHAHWLSSASEASSVSPAMVSDWLIWFCDQMGDLKVASSPALRAQIGLYARLNASVTASSKAAAPEGVSSVAPVTNASKTTPLSQRHSAPPSRPVSAASPDDRRNEAASVASGDDAQQAIIQKISAEFPVLMPVIKGATLMLSHNVLYLVLDETYQFFQKKLSEPKFKDRFLALYNEHHKSQVSEWSVTTDVNDIYAAAPSAESSTHDTLSSSATLPVGSNQKTSKTVNQIIEMFDGQIIQ